MAIRDISVDLAGQVTIYFEEGHQAEVRVEPAEAAQIVSAALRSYMQQLAPGIELEPVRTAHSAPTQAPPMSPREVLANMPAPPLDQTEIIGRIEEAVAKLRLARLVTKSVISREGDAIVVTLTNMVGEPTGLKLTPRYMNDAGVQGFIEMLGEVATATPERLEDDLL